MKIQYKRSQDRAFVDSLKDFLKEHWPNLVGLLIGGAGGGYLGYQLAPKDYKGWGTVLGAVAGAGFGSYTPNLLKSIFSTTKSEQPSPAVQPKELTLQDRIKLLQDVGYRFRPIHWKSLETDPSLIAELETLAGDPDAVSTMTLLAFHYRDKPLRSLLYRYYATQLPFDLSRQQIEEIGDNYELLPILLSFNRYPNARNALRYKLENENKSVEQAIREYIVQLFEPHYTPFKIEFKGELPK